MIQPLHDRVLIRRIEEDSPITLTDRPKGIKGVILAVGPGEWIEGINGGQVRKRMEVKPGDIVLFNSKWNDFAAGENVGTGADGSGPLERPLPLTGDPMIHLVREADIFCKCNDPELKASLKLGTIESEYMQNIEIKGPWNGGNPHEGTLQIKHG